MHFTICLCFLSPLEAAVTVEKHCNCQSWLTMWCLKGPIYSKPTNRKQTTSHFPNLATAKLLAWTINDKFIELYCILCLIIPVYYCV